jgi:FkbM family methyltransferase
MDWLERHLAIFPTPKRVIVVGAGHGRDLPALMRSTPEHLVLLEPHPQWADFLRRQTAAAPRTEVLEYALDDQSGRGTLTVFNFPELNSLRPDPALASLLPGAQQTARLSVEIRSLKDLLQQWDESVSGNNWLIIDAPGLEQTVLRSLADPDVRSHFGHIVLRTGQHLYDGVAKDAESLEGLMLARGFRILGEADLSDGDWPRVHLQQFNDSGQHKKLEARFETLKLRSKALAKEKHQLQDQLKETRRELEDRLAELQSLRQQRNERTDKLQEVIDQTKSDLSVSLRLQTLRENDLKELQTRYAEVLETRDAQHRLLLKIRKRLSLAAEYLSQLKNEHDEQRKNELTSGLVESLAHGFSEGD